MKPGFISVHCCLAYIEGIYSYYKVGVYGISDNSAKIAEFAAFGGVLVGVDDTLDNSAKFAEFALFRWVGVWE